MDGRRRGGLSSSDRPCEATVWRSLRGQGPRRRSRVMRRCLMSQLRPGSHGSVPASHPGSTTSQSSSVLKNQTITQPRPQTHQRIYVGEARAPLPLHSTNCQLQLRADHLKSTWRRASWFASLKCWWCHRHLVLHERSPGRIEVGAVESSPTSQAGCNGFGQAADTGVLGSCSDRRGCLCHLPARRAS